MNAQSKFGRPNPVLLLLLFLCFAACSASAISDTVSLIATNPWTKQQVTFNLLRYNLRSTNYQVRVYSDATNFTLLPTNQIPEATTYRGRIPTDTGAMVVGSFGPDGKFYYNVSYGCRWQENMGEADPYDGTNRLSWGGWGANFATTNIPTLGYVTNYTVAPTNIPQHITWATNNYSTNMSVGYGGPAWLNTFQQVPAQRVRIIQEMDQSVFVGTCGSNASYAILMQESRINEMDYIMMRDYGICYQIACICIRPYTNAPFTAAGNSRLPQLSAYWGGDPGYSGGNFANGWFDMAQATLYEGGGVAYAPGDWALTDPGFNGNVQGHENGHNWGAADYVTGHDYTGDNQLHCSHTGSGYANGTDEVMAALALRRTSWKRNYEWVKYNSPLAPHTTPDFASTKTNTPVSLNVLLNDYVCNSNTLSIASFETNTPAGGYVTNLGSGFLQYTPPANFAGYDLFHYYATEPSGLKSLCGVKILVTNPVSPLLAEWRFDQTNGSSVLETTGNAPAGTLYGSASFSSGSVPGINGGRALHLDGSGYARFKGTWLDPLNASISVSVWCKPDATPAGAQMIFMKSDNNWNRESGLRIGMNASSIFVNGSTFGGQNSGFSAVASIAPQGSTWYHIVAEVDRSSNLVRLFVNGVEYIGTSSTRTVPTGEFIVGENWPIIGAANSTEGWGSYFTGAIADLRLYTKALTTSEVQGLYLGGGLLPAGGPQPADGDYNIAMQPAMSWQKGGTNNFQFDVYLGTNSAAVAGATTNTAGIYQGRFATAAFTPATSLATNTAYFWRVDEVLGTNLVASEVWTFTTAIDAIHAGLRLYLPFDSRDTVGSTTYDRSGPPFHDGTLNNGPIQTNGPVYEALAFDGTTSYVETPALNMSTARATFVAWVRRNGNLVNYAGIVFCRGGSTVAGLDVRGTSNQLGYHWNDASSTYNYVSGLTLPDGQWVLAALTVETNRAIFYMGQTNGVIQTATNNITHVVQGFEGTMNIARDSAGGRCFGGAIDEVGVWSRPLTRAEVGQILTNGINGVSFAGSRPVATTGTFTWTGNSDVYWTNALNWATNAVPGAADIVYFNDSASGNTATLLGSNIAVAGINIGGGVRGVGISSTNKLTLGAGGIAATNSVVSLTLASPLALASAQTWVLGPNATANLTGALSGTGNPALTIAGGGTVNLNNGNSYSGSLIVNNGRVNLPYGWNSPSLVGNVGVGASGTLTFDSHPYSYAAVNYTTNAGLLVVDGDAHCANLILNGGQVAGTGGLRVGNIWGSGGSFTSKASPQTANISIGWIALYVVNSVFTVEDGAADPDWLISTPIGDGNVSGNFTKSGAGKLVLTKPCTFTGNITNNQGMLLLSDSDNVLPVTTSLTIASGATVGLDNISQTIAGLSGQGTLSLGAGGVEILTSKTNTFGGVITGAPGSGGVSDVQAAPSGGLAVDGGGKLTLTNRQTYAGETWVVTGTLALTGVGAITNSTNIVLSSGTTLDVTGRTDGSLNLTPGQWLSGYGTVLGKVSVTNGAIVSIGSQSPGTLATGTNTWHGGGVCLWQISDPVNSSGMDLLNVSGALNVAATPASPFILKIASLTPVFAAGPLTGFNNQSNYQWTVAASTKGVSNFNASAFVLDTSGFSNSLAGGSFSLSQSGNSLVLNFAPAVAATISNQPSSLTVYVGSNATFTVTAGGAPTPAYQWRFNGTNLANATAATLTVTNAQPANEGAYTVVVTNIAGAQTSSPAMLNLFREFGSAPAPYPTLLSSNGARHLIVPGFQLGATNVASADARTNAFGNDGVAFLTSLTQGQSASIRVTASAPGYLSAWIDYGNNGSWADALDQVLTNASLVAGTNTLNFTVPWSAVVSTSAWSRFRFSSATNLSFVGEAPSGEVEDYNVAVASNPPPVIVLNSPANGAAYTAPAAVSLAATVTTNGNLINKVQFIESGTNMLAELTAQPFAYAWTNVSAGAYTLSARLFYNGSSTTDSAAVGVVVTNAPALPPNPPTISQAAIGSSQSFVLTCSGTSSQTYLILAGQDLNAVTNWIAIGTNSAGTNGLFQFTDSDAINYSNRFYRLRQQ